MSARRVVYTRHADRDLLRLPQKDRAAVADAVEAWGRGEEHVDVEKLADVRPPEWRIRVGRWRALVDRPGEKSFESCVCSIAKMRIADET
ncbi:MAG: type II toxin-antitoxin system RelE family toxin [Vulcanimicrobiaceae bacterium]